MSPVPSVTLGPGRKPGAGVSTVGARQALSRHDRRVVALWTPLWTLWFSLPPALGSFHVGRPVPMETWERQAGRTQAEPASPLWGQPATRVLREWSDILLARRSPSRGSRC